MPTVSVIVTTYNRPQLLKETISSILSQTYNDFELIVVDNFSNYNFFELIESFSDSRIRPFQNQNNGIIAVNRNVGIKNTIGEFIAFCDDDDIWMENKLEAQIKKIEETGCDFISSNTLYFRSSINKIIGKSKNRKIKNIQDFVKKNQINTSTVMIRNINGLCFNEDKNLIAVEDYLFWLELYIKGVEFEFILEPLVYYRINGGNISQKNWEINHVKIIYLISSLIINNPDLKISNQFLYIVFINVIKFYIKKVLVSK